MATEVAQTWKVDALSVGAAALALLALSIQLCASAPVLALGVAIAAIVVSLLARRRVRERRIQSWPVSLFAAVIGVAVALWALLDSVLFLAVLSAVLRN